MMAKIKRNHIVLIDGYNVINAWPELKKYINEDLEAARDLLVEKLINYSYFSDEKVIVVFDAYMVKGNFGSERTHKGVKIIFTEESQTADAYIEAKVNTLVQDRRNMVKVVTYDWAEQMNVLGSGAIRVTPEEFKYKILDAEKRLRRKYVKKAQKDETPDDTSVDGTLSKDVLDKLKQLKDLE